MKVLDIKGDAYQRGLAQGKEIREKWLQLEHDFFTSELISAAKPWFLPTFVVKIALKTWGKNRTKPTVHKYLPTAAKRVEGLAEGLGMPSNYAWGLQYAEILFCLAGDSIEIPGNIGCTQAHATPKATAEGRPLTGRNYDFPNMLLPYQIVRRETPAEKDRLATLTATQVALCGSHQGINEAGLTIGSNNNRAWMEQDYNVKGIPTLMLLQEALETCRTTSEAVEFMSKFPQRASAGFFGIMDDSGDCRVLEFTASRFSVRTPDDAGVLAQSNHFINMKEANIPDGTKWKIKGMEHIDFHESTRARYAATDRLLHENAGKITVDTLKSILSDHSYDPKGKGTDSTICAHGEAGSTLSSYVIDIKDRVMYVAEDNPCRSKYERVEFRYK